MKYLLLLSAVFYFASVSDCKAQSTAAIRNVANRSAVHYDIERPYREGFAAVCRKNKWGFINRSREEVIPLLYKKACDFIEYNAVVYAEKYLLIDTTGKIINEVTDAQAKRFFAASVTGMNAPGFLPGNKNNFSSSGNFTPVPTAGNCPPNIDFEYGDFSNWYCYTGLVGTNQQGNNIVTMFNNTPSTNAPVAGRHRMIVAAANSELDYYGGFPINPPNGSGHAIKLGNDDIHDSAEKVRYIIHVPVNAVDFSVTFQYAVVLENPVNNTRHTPDQKPRMTAQVIDATTNTVVQCADFLYVAAGSIPGFYNSAVDPNVKCKAWTPVFVNLRAYAGKTLYLEFLTADCTLGAHFGYGYVDVGPCNEPVTSQYQCAPSVANFTAPPGFQYYNWWNNDYSAIVGTGATLSMSPLPATGTTFHVELIPINNSSCRDTLSAVVNPSLPSAYAGPDEQICAGQSIPIGVTPVPGYTYQWSPPDYLSDPNISNPISSAPVPVTYTLTVTDAYGCIASDAASVMMNAMPAPDFTVADIDQCIYQNNFSFHNTTSISGGTYSIVWNFGDGSTSTANDPQHHYSFPGTYTVTLTATSDLGCINIKTQQVIVLEKPSVSFLPNNPTQCVTNNNFIFYNSTTINVGGLSYVWHFGDGETSTQQNPTHHYAASGNYTVQLVVTSTAGCTDSITGSVVVTALPVAAFGITDPPQCLINNSFSFTNTSSLPGETLTYHWDFGDGSSSNLQTPVHQYTSSGNYNVVLTVTSPTGCTDNISHSLIVFPKPTVAFAPSANMQCLRGNTISFANNSLITTGSISYHWSFGDGTFSVLVNPSHAYAATGVYTVQLIATSDNGCIDSTSQLITINPNPQIIAGTTTSATICRGSSITLNAGGGSSYNWFPATALNCSSCANPVATPLTDISYIVTGLNNFNCAGRDTVKITVIQPFTMQALGSNVCVGGSTGLHASGAATYFWQPAAGLNRTDISNPTAAPLSTTMYTVVGYDTSHCFTDTAWVPVTVFALPAVSLGADLTLPTGTTQVLNANITNGPIISWLWTPANFLNCNTCPAPVATIHKDMTYTVTVKNIHGCVASDEIRIKTFCENSQVFIPDAFTPDGDGINDIFMIRGSGIISVKYLRIFNRWGELIFEKNNFSPNNPACGWDGKIRGVKGPPDVFVYTVEVVCDNNMKNIFKGNVSIIK